jgi:hexosaminidase
MNKLNSYFVTISTAICIMFGCSSVSSFAANNKYNIIPLPQKLIPEKGVFDFNKRTVILCSFKQTGVKKLAQQFSDQFALVSGMKPEVREFSTTEDTTNAIIFQSSSFPESIEAYQLQVTPKTIRIKAQATNGFFYGLQTIYQLLPAEIYGKKKSTVKRWSVPAVFIADAPRFAYRGLHLDVCRHFFPVEFIKKYIDAMAIHKLNTFHWHLTDDQGWRIEIKKYPKLTEVGSKRDETLVDYYYARFPQQFDGKPYGGFYTQEDAREVVAYAKDRFITVIPEIELPGHAQAAVASYPYLSCTQDSTIKVATRWGIFPEVYCPRESTFTFLEDVLTEIMNIFPSEYIHIGGDECPKDRWKTCPDCQALIKNLHLKDENGLQSYFVERIEKFVNSKGRKIIGWDEILDGGLAPNATVMSWRGTKGGIAAAKSGHDVIMSPGTHCYFDKYQADPATEPVTIGGYLPLQTVYQYEPVPTELKDTEALHILGAQANVWTEYMPTSGNVEYMTFPRLSALAEVVWSNKNRRNWDSFRNRMSEQFERYDKLELHPSKAFFDVQFQSGINSENKLQVALVCDDPDVRIHYSTNGNPPILKDALYYSPFTLDKSGTITATAFKKGKAVGKPLTKSYQVSKLTGLSYTPNSTSTWYDGGNPNALTDGKFGNTKVSTQWAGIGQGSDIEIVIDMKTIQKIERFSVGMLNAPAICALLSPEIRLFGSVDGVEYKQLAEKQITRITAPTWEIFRPELIFPSVEVRYLKLFMKSAGDCTNISQEKVRSILMIDEIGAW